MENIFFLVLVGVIGLIRLLIQIAEKKKNANARPRSAPVSNATLARPAAETEEERVRKFFDALGIPNAGPATETRPRQFIPKSPRTKRPLLPIDPFPAPRVGGIPPMVESAPTLTPAPEKNPGPPASTVPARPTALAPSERAPAFFEVHDIDKGTFESGRLESLPSPATARAKITSPEQGVIERLTSRERLREAIILREIFGPPRSLQPCINIRAT